MLKLKRRPKIRSRRTLSLLRTRWRVMLSRKKLLNRKWRLRRRKLLRRKKTHPPRRNPFLLQIKKKKRMKTKRKR